MNIQTNIQKLIAIFVAVLINVLALAWFHAWSANVVASATPPTAQVESIRTLRTIEVRPSAEQLRVLRLQHAAPTPKQADAGGQVACADMAYYSFAAPCTAEATG